MTDSLGKYDYLIRKRLSYTELVWMSSPEGYKYSERKYEGF